MRIAILADIHGNLPALEAALADVARLQVDQLVILGDIVVGSPDSLACWERVKGLRCSVLRGNHERYVFDLDTERARPEWSTQQFAPVRFAAQQLGVQQREELARLPPTLKLRGCEDVLFVHASARNDNDLVFPYTTDEALEPMFAGATEPWLVRGHNHFASVRLWGHRKIVTVGAVGLPLDGTPAAQFTVMEKRGGEWRVNHRCARYDVRETLRRFQESGYLDTAGPIARLYFREVMTASFHMIPFLRFYGELKTREPEISLESAVTRFWPGGLREISDLSI